MQTKKIKRKKIILNVLYLLTFTTIILCVVFAARFHDGISTLYGVVPLSGINGSIQALGFFFCLCMVYLDYKKGRKRSIFCIVIMLIFTSVGIVMRRRVENLPGVINCLLQICSIILLSNHLEKSHKAAVTDSATGLMNRYGFERYVESNIDKKRGESLVYLHLDNVASVNAKYGRECGDALLKIVADRILNALGNDGIPFKIEGAEYTLLLKASCNLDKVLNNLICEIEKPMVLPTDEGDVNWYLTVSLGVVDNRNVEYDAESLMRNADFAMNYAIRDTKNKICVFEASVKAVIERQIELANLVKEGLERDYFYFVYQPQFFTESKKIRGFESLIRMRLPDGSIVSPGEFIPIAEMSDLCLKIDEYVLDKVTKEFRNVCLERRDMLISVNISAKGISMEGFAEKLFSIIEANNFPYGCLEVEITEYSLVDSFDNTINNIKKLRQKGVKIALDDFGSGYTSLSEVLKLPVDLIKIDKSLIDNVTIDETNSDFVKTVIYLGHLMNCEVISEGVESEDQLEIIRQYNCDLVQGYIWGKPLEFEKACKLLLENS